MVESAPPAGEASIFTATTNWIVGSGSLDNSISFDSCAAPDDEAIASTGDALLLRPEGDDPPPCEITIYFKKKHEIRMVYVRSTARVYEVYYASDHNDSSKEYLCTVKCGAAEEEEVVISQDFSAGASINCQENNDKTTAVQEIVARSNSNSSDEDSWVKVKASDSFLHYDEACSSSKRHDWVMDSPKVQVHYEATAEISDSSPCVSLTFRLLSVLSKDRVHVDEIYVCADPVESCGSEQPVAVSENFGGSSLLAMLVPRLMQLSKSGTKRDESPGPLVEPKAPKNQYDTGKTAQGVQECSYISPYHKLETEVDRAEAKVKKLQHESGQGIITTNPLQTQSSFADQHSTQAYGRIEKVLGELVLKVGRVEVFCSKFEENMLKPLNCMEERLQQLEQKMDALVLKNQPSEQCPCSRVSSPESDKSHSENSCGDFPEHTELKETSISFIDKALQDDEVACLAPEYYTSTGLVMKAPEFLINDGESSNTEDTLDPLMGDSLQNNKLSDTLDPSILEYYTSTGLVMKAPEFLIDDGEFSNTEDTLDPLMGDFLQNDKLTDTLDLSILEDSPKNDKLSLDPSIVEDSPKIDKISSIDSALASSLAAFLSSTTNKSSKCNSSTIASSEASVIGESSTLTSFLGLPSAVEGGNICGTIDATGEGTLSAESSLLTCDANMSFDRSDVLGVCTTNSDDSLFVAIADESSHTSSPQSSSGSLVMSPILFIEDITCTTRDVILNSLKLNRLEEDQTCTTPADRQTAPLLAELLYSGAVPTSQSTEAVHSDELSASVSAVLNDGADELGPENQDRCEMKDEVLYMEHILSLSPNNIMLQEDQDMNNSLAVKTVDDDEHFVEILDRHLLIDLNEGVIAEDHTNNNAAERGENVLNLIDQDAGGWTESSSSISSSPHEKCTKKKIIVTAWSAFAIEDSTFQRATNDCDNEPVSDIENVCSLGDYTTGITTTQSSADWRERSNVELEDMMGDVRFVSETNWTSGLPLELMIGKGQDAEPLDVANGHDGEDDEEEFVLQVGERSLQGLS